MANCVVCDMPVCAIACTCWLGCIRALVMPSLCTRAACSLDAYAVYRRQNEIDSGDLSAAHVGMIPDAIKQETGTGSAMLQPGQHFELQKLKASDDQQTQRGKLASQVSAGAQPCQQREKSGTDTDLQGQVKSKNKKKNRLGQRARQQLGRAKQAENCPKKTFMVSQTFLWQQNRESLN